MKSSRLILKKIIAPFINMYLLSRHIKAELVSEVPQLCFREYIF
jgi:hypothetical protein